MSMLEQGVNITLSVGVGVAHLRGRRTRQDQDSLPLSAGVRCALVALTAPLVVALVQLVLAALGIHGYLATALAWLMTATCAYLTGRRASAQDGSPVLRRGAEIRDAAEWRGHVRGFFGLRPPAPATGPDRTILSIAGVPIPPEDEPKHFKFIGTTGTGKSTAIQGLLSAALARGDRAVIADPDGGYLRRHYDARRGDLILNPFDGRSGVWQPFDELVEAHDARELARALIGSASGEAAAWHDYAETFLASVLERLKGLPEAGSAELYRVISSASMVELRAMLSGTSSAPLVESGNERMFGSVRAIAMSRLAALPVIVRQSGVHASVRQWIREGSGVLFLPYQADQIATLRHLISAWMRLAIFETMALGESDRRLWFVVDELDALGAIDGLKDALARLRKFGGRCVLGFQSIAQVSGTYGEAQARTIVENCATTLILRCSSSEGGGTARFASQLIGQREVERFQETRSTGERGMAPRVSVSRQIALESAVLASEIEGLADLEGYLKRASEPAWTRVTLRPAQADSPIGSRG